jgi:hypothetical protein
MLNQRTRDGLRLRSSGLARISLGGLGIGEVVLQPTDKVSHDGGPAVVSWTKSKVGSIRVVGPWVWAIIVDYRLSIR